MNNTARRANALGKSLGAKRYLEIGVLHGNTFRDVDIADRTAVDPGFGFDTNELANESTRFFRETSDSFFTHDPILPPYDVVLIDGLHTFEQVVRDLSNVLLRTHARSAIILDDTVPDDAYSTVQDAVKSYKYREMDKAPAYGWQGDVFKTVFYIHDFLPGLNYRTIMRMGNPQTIVWRSNGMKRTPVFGNLETISRMTYFDFKDHLAVMQPGTEDEAIAQCVAEINAL